MARTARKSASATLPGLDDSGPARGGPVYRGVCTQIRHWLDGDEELAKARAGLAAQARTLAHTIDCASGHGGNKVETYALPQLHRELRELLANVAGDGSLSDDDALRDLLAGPPPEGSA